MFRYLIQRLLVMIPTLIVISIAIFTIIQAPPGDFLETYMAELQSQGEAVDPEKIEFLPPGMRKTDVTPVGLVMTKDGKTAFVTLGHAAHVAVVDVPTRKIQGYILVGKRSWGITLSRDESKLFVANGFGDDVTIIDAKSRKAIVSVPVGRIPWGVAIDD